MPGAGPDVFLFSFVYWDTFVRAGFSLVTQGEIMDGMGKLLYQVVVLMDVLHLGYEYIPSACVTAQLQEIAFLASSTLP